MTRSQTQQLAAYRAHVTMTERALRRARSFEKRSQLTAKLQALQAIIEATGRN